jgi:hypothetical protein
MYRIVKNTYWGENGEPEQVHYHLERRSSFLGLKFWRALRHRECYESGAYSTVTTFSTLVEAREYYQRIRSGVKPTSWTAEIVENV